MRSGGLCIVPRGPLGLEEDVRGEGSAEKPFFEVLVVNARRCLKVLRTNMELVFDMRSWRRASRGYLF